MKTDIRSIIEDSGELFSASLGIDLEGGREEEIFRWFLASILFGKRISSEIAARTYRIFESRGTVSIDSIQKLGWDGLVQNLDDGGYVRYDFSTATRLLEITEKIKSTYGSLTEMHRQAEDPRDLEKKLMDHKGIGPVTVNIFLRELRTVWKNADPPPMAPVVEEAASLGIDLGGIRRKTKKFVRLEAALIRRLHSRKKA